MDAIRTGILHVPVMDDDAAAAIVGVLRSAGVRPIVMLESSAQSQRNWIVDVLCRWSDEEELDLIMTIGGILPAPGPSGQEIVAEATAGVVERLLPGLAEAMRAYAQEESDLALLQCGIAGIRGRTLIVNLPQGAGPAALFLEAISALIGPVVAHLQERPDAPDLAHALADSAHDEYDAGPVPEADEDDRRFGLNEDEFAEYLRRTASDDSGTG